jgi:hypothetical protein
MGAQPVRDGVGVSSGQHVDWSMGMHVQQHGAVHVPPPKREVVNAEDLHRPWLRLGQAAQQLQQGVPTCRHA